MDYIKVGDRVRILRGPYADRTGIVTYFNDPALPEASSKQIHVTLDNSDDVALFDDESLLEKVKENQP